MQGRTAILILGLALLPAACRTKEKLVTVAEERTELPALLLGIFELPNVDTLEPTRRFLRPLDPKLEALVHTVANQHVRRIAAALIEDVATLSFEKPIQLYWLDPAIYSPPWVLVGASEGPWVPASDRVQVQRLGAHRIAGEQTAIAAIRDAAMQRLQARRNAARAELFPRALYKAYESEVEELGRDMQAPPPGEPDHRSTLLIVRSVLQLLGAHADRAVVTTDAQHRLTLTLTMVEESPLATFIATQTPGRFELLDSLPAEPDPDLLFLGSLRAGPMFDTVVELLGRVIPFGTGTQPLSTPLERVAATLDGRMAVAIGPDEGRAAFVFGTQAPRDTEAQILDLGTALQKIPRTGADAASRVLFRPNASLVGAFGVHEYIHENPTAKLKQVTRATVVSDRWIGASKRNARPALETAVNATGKKAAPYRPRMEVHQWLEAADKAQSFLAVWTFGDPRRSVGIGVTFRDSEANVLFELIPPSKTP